MDTASIEQMIRAGLPDATVTVTGEDGVHFEARVSLPVVCRQVNFTASSMVYATLGEYMGREIHALAFATPRRRRDWLNGAKSDTGGVPLNGEVWISGAKNAVLPILVASLLGDQSFANQQCSASAGCHYHDGIAGADGGQAEHRRQNADRN